MLGLYFSRNFLAHLRRHDRRGEIFVDTLCARVP